MVTNNFMQETAQPTDSNSTMGVENLLDVLDQLFFRDLRGLKLPGNTQVMI
jgi:hypothetical protein